MCTEAVPLESAVSEALRFGEPLRFLLTPHEFLPLLLKVSDFGGRVRPSICGQLSKFQRFMEDEKVATVRDISFCKYDGKEVWDIHPEIYVDRFPCPFCARWETVQTEDYQQP